MTRRWFLGLTALLFPAVAGAAPPSPKNDTPQRMTVEELLRKLWREAYGDTPFPEIVTERQALGLDSKDTSPHNIISHHR